MSDLQQNLVSAFDMCLSGQKEQLQQGNKFIMDSMSKNHYSSTLMLIINNEEIKMDTRQYALTSLKYLVEKKWICKDQTQQISEEDKNAVRSNLLEAIIRVSGQAKLYKTYEKIIYQIALNDFPNRWPTIANDIKTKLESCEDFNTLFGCLLTSKTLIKCYEYQISDQERAPLEEMASVMFPVYLKICSKIWSQYNIQTAILLQQVLKSIYISFNISFPKALRDLNQLGEWFGFFKIVYQFQVPSEYTITPQSDSQLIELNKVIFWRNKKIISKIFMRVAQKFSVMRLKQRDIPEFDQMFMTFYLENHATGLIDMFMTLLNSTKTQFVSMPTLHFSLRYIQMSLRDKSLTEYMKDQLIDLALNVCTPCLQMNNKDQNLFVNDPIEFMRREEDFTSTVFNPRCASMDLLLEFTRIKDSKNIYTLLEHFYQQLNSGTCSLQAKDGILWAFGILVDEISSYKDLKDNVEQILESFALPHMAQDNHVPFLRARACWLYGTFGHFDFKSQSTIENVTKQLCIAITDKNTVIKTKAAIALNKFLRQKMCADIVRGEVKNLVSIYLKLMELVDSEQLVNALQGIISHYSHEIQGFSVGLIQNLVEAFKRYDEQEGDEDDFDYSGDCAAAECISAINKIILAIENPEVYEKVEFLLLPIINSNWSQHSEYLEEIINTVCVLTKKAPKLSANLFFYFVSTSYSIIGIPDSVNVEQIPQINEDQLSILQECKPGMGIEYVSNMMPIFKNFIQKDMNSFLTIKDFQQNTFYELMLLTVDKTVQSGTQTEEYGEVASVLDYFIAFIENNIGNSAVQDKVTQIVNITLTYLNKLSNEKIVARNCYTILATSMYYNPEILLGILSGQNITNIFFDHMFTLYLTKVPKKKLSDYELQKIMLGLTKLLTLNQSQMQVLQEIFPKLMKMFVFLEQNLLELREIDEDEIQEDYDDFSDFDYEVKAEYDQHYDTPFDDVDELISFSNELQNIQQRDQQLYQNLLNLLSAEEQADLDKCMKDAFTQYQEYLNSKKQQ